MNLFNTASAKNLQTTHLINQHTVHAAPVLALPPEDKTSLFRRSIQHNYADLLKNSGRFRYGYWSYRPSRDSLMDME